MVNFENRNKYYLGIFGLVSGLISAIGMQHASASINWMSMLTGGDNSLSSLFYFYGPGLVFGLAFLTYFSIQKQLTISKGKLVGYLMISTLAYSGSLYLYLVGDIFISLYGGLFSAGFFGALIVTIAFSYIISKLDKKQIILLSITGGLAVLLGSMGGGLFSSLEFLFWPTAIAFGLGWCMDLNQKKIVLR